MQSAEDDLRIHPVANYSIDRHSSRNFPLNDSLVPFCHGFPTAVALYLGHRESVDFRGGEMETRYFASFRIF